MAVILAENGLSEMRFRGGMKQRIASAVQHANHLSILHNRTKSTARTAQKKGRAADVAARPFPFLAGTGGETALARSGDPAGDPSEVTA
jgi:hypothetical protein